MTIMGQRLLAHESAEIFPLMDGADLDELARDIKDHGQREAIILHPDGRILEGRNRYEACVRADVLPVFKAWSGTPGTEIDFVISMNLRRRHLTESQRAMVAARIRKKYAAQAKERQGARSDLSANLREGEAGKASEKAAAQLNVSPRSVETATQVLRDGAPELVAAVDRGETSLNAASAIAELPPEQQQEIVARGEADILAAAKEIRERRKKNSTDAFTSASAEGEERYSPEVIVELARRVMGRIDLDPASCEAANRVVQATTYYTKDQDGLTQPLFGCVWANPPYGWSEERESLSGLWTKRLLNARAGAAVEQVTILVFAATGDKWFQPLWDHALCFPDGRLSFWTTDEDGQRVELTQPMKSSVVVYSGANVEAFAREFSMIGRVCIPARLLTPDLMARLRASYIDPAMSLGREAA